jgi:hypothetical protein
VLMQELEDQKGENEVLCRRHASARKVNIDWIELNWIESIELKHRFLPKYYIALNYK